MLFCFSFSIFFNLLILRLSTFHEWIRNYFCNANEFTWYKFSCLEISDHSRITESLLVHFSSLSKYKIHNFFQESHFSGWSCIYCFSWSHYLRRRCAKCWTCICHYYHIGSSVGYNQVKILSYLRRSRSFVRKFGNSSKLSCLLKNSRMMKIILHRKIIPDENCCWQPENLMTEVLAEVHYLPDAWRGHAHTTFVRDQFSQLFQYKFVSSNWKHFLKTGYVIVRKYEVL